MILNRTIAGFRGQVGFEGQCTFHVGGETFKAGPGTFISIPRLVEHSTIKPYSSDAKNAPANWTLDNLWIILATADQTVGSYSLIEELCSTNSGPVPHTHAQDEVIYIIEGEITLIAGDLKTTIKAGSLGYIPAHCVHTFRVVVDKTRTLNFYFPGGSRLLLSNQEFPLNRVLCRRQALGGQKHQTR